MTKRKKHPKRKPSAPLPDQAAAAAEEDAQPTSREAANSGQNFSELFVIRMLPNVATIIALCTGLSAIRFALASKFQEAVLAILIAAFMDAVDGRIARLLKATSNFGAELDSLSDFVSFGVAPAVVIYIASLSNFDRFGWGIVLFYAICMALRLARFNATNIEQLKNEPANASPTYPEKSKRFFVGVPAPAGAFIVLLPLMLDFTFEINFFRSPYMYACMMVVASLLVISRIPTFSFKGSRIKRTHVLPFLVFLTILVICAINMPWMVASALVVTYIIMLPFSYRAFHK